MRKFQCLLFVLKRSYIYVICVTVPLKSLANTTVWLSTFAKLHNPSRDYVSNVSIVNFEQVNADWGIAISS